MDAMTCRRARALLQRYADAELRPSEGSAVRQHLLSCPRCRATVSETTSVRRFFDATEEVRAPAGFADAVLAAARREGPPGAMGELEDVRRFALRMAAAAALLLAVGGGGVLVGGALADRHGGALEARTPDAIEARVKERFEKTRPIPPAPASPTETSTAGSQVPKEK